MKNSCKICLYCIPLTGLGLQVFVCANKADRPGRLTLTLPQNSCDNHKKTKTANRPSVIQPTDSAIRLIPLTQGKVAIVDAADFDWLSQYKWYTNKKASGFYACTHKGNKLLYMHRLIMQISTKNSKLKTQNCHRQYGDGIIVDHIDRNALNNRRSNLRFCTPRQNCFNQRPKHGTSKYKGVHWDKEKRKWVASIAKNNKAIKIGIFNNEEDAARAYDEMAKKLFGEFAYLNFAD